MTTTDTKTCRDCGADFAKSRQDYTVRCHDCRGSRGRKASACIVCDGTGKVASRSAVTGAVSHFNCHRCA